MSVRTAESSTSGAIYSPRRLQHSLKPFRLYYAARMRSTNNHALQLRRRRQLYAPAVVLTSHQMAGRGRGSNTWWSGAGSITATFCIPVDPQRSPHHIPLLAGLCVRDALLEVLQQSPAAQQIKIKWPNDLWHDDLKLAGLLCERFDHVDFIGVGLNVNVNPADIPKGLRHRVTSVNALVNGTPLNLSAVLCEIARQIAGRLMRVKNPGESFPDESFAVALRQLQRVHALTGRLIRVTEPGQPAPLQGICQGIGSEGELLLATPGGTRAVVAGHVEIVV
jgi:BirA family transcriptional regulator, biotin operon repressor / biotin---[acetyl-CoA-carboxylase] ligase